ncbi:hypothetical protein TNCV_4612051 [Trichonephila clavipes]|nr:hypothetical protein TNCV_4612051 [Trichonephila clavipes]
MNSCLVLHTFESSTAEDLSCRWDWCMLNMSRLKCPPEAVVWKFKKGDRSCRDQARSGWSSHVGEDIYQAIRNNPNPTVLELAETVNVHWTTVKRRLVNSGFTRKCGIVMFHIT